MRLLSILCGQSIMMKATWTIVLTKKKNSKVECDIDKLKCKILSNSTIKICTQKNEKLTVERQYWDKSVTETTERPEVSETSIRVKNINEWL